MATPCILAVGTRDAWRGVPCKMDGYESWTGAVVVDRVVRGGVRAAADALVRGFGWECAGGEPLTEPDDFLGGELSESTPQDVLDRHYAVYVLDPAANRVDVSVAGTWLEPATFNVDGTIATLPSWYPQLGARTAGKRRRPEAITKQLQARCLAMDIRWASLAEALRRWCTMQLGDLTGVAWLYLGGESAEHVRCLIDDTFVYAAVDAHGSYFTGADGKQRTIDIDDLDLAERCFEELTIRRSHALPVLEEWISLAYAAGSGKPNARVTWAAGIRRWSFYTVEGGLMRDDPIPLGLLPTLLCWLY